MASAGFILLAGPSVWAEDRAAPAMAATAIAGPATWAGDETAGVGEYGCTKPTTTVAVGGLGRAKPASRLPVLSNKAWPEGSINMLGEAEA